MSTLIAQLVTEFSARERLVVLLKHCDELTVAEIAAVIDISEDEVRRIEADVIVRVRQILNCRRLK